MASNLKPVLLVVCLITLGVWFATAAPSGAQQAAPTGEPPAPASGDNVAAAHHESHGDNAYDHDLDEHPEEEDEEDHHDLEEEYQYYDVRRLEMQAIFGELELLQELADVASDQQTAAAMAILRVAQEIDDESRTEEFLLELLQDGRTTDGLRRLVRLKLIEVYQDLDQPEKSLEMARGIVFGN